MLRGHEVRLCIYSWDDQLSFDNNMTYQNINNVPGSSYMTFYSGNILVVDKTSVLYSDENQSDSHLFSASEHYQRHLLLPKQFKDEPWSPAIEKTGLFLYKGKIDGVVEVFKLNYQ